MQSQDPAVIFGKEHASEYDKRFAKLAAMRDALHLLMRAVLADLPADARILCVGAGTGLEIIYLADKFPQWQFTAVDPSAAMLEVCRRSTQEHGIESRCTFHVGYLDSLPPTEPFDAATSLLVSHFILTAEARTGFFQSIAKRLRPGGCLINADLASDVTTPAYESLLEVWIKLMQIADVPADKAEAMRIAYSRDVALLPLEEVSAIIAAGGFDTPVRFLQTGLIHAWYAHAVGA